MKTSTITLFESAQANFRLTLQTMYEKLKVDGTTQSKVFYNQQNESLNANVGTFLCFYYYVSDDFKATKAVFTSTAHIYYIRDAVAKIHDYLYQPDLTIDVNGVKVINPKYAEPVTIAEIGQKQDWISFRLFIDEAMNILVGVTTSKSNNYTSNLLVKEFFSVYDIIMHLDFASLEYQAVTLEMISKLMKQGTPKTNSYINNNRAPRSYQGNQGFVPPRPVTTQPQASYPTYAQHTKAAPLPPRPSEPRATSSIPLAPVGSSTPIDKKRPSMTMEELDNIPVEEEDFLSNPLTDEDEINAIFGDR